MNTEFYYQDKIKLFDLDDKYNKHYSEIFSENDIPFATVFFKLNHRVTYLYIGAWCFIYTPKNKKNEMFFNLQYLKKDRIKGVSFLLEKITENQIAHSTSKSLYKEAGHFFNYLNKNFPDHNCMNLEHAEEIYQSFTRHLIEIVEKKKIKGNQSYRTEHQQSQQGLAALFLSTCCSINVNHFYTKFRKIDNICVKAQVIAFDSNNDINKGIKILADIFLQISEFFIKQNPLPLVIDLTQYDLGIKYIDINFLLKSSKDFIEILYSQKKIRDLDDFEKVINTLYSHDREKIRILRKKYHARIKRINEYNAATFENCNPKILLFNFMTMAFAKLLIAATGANESTIYNLTLKSFKTIASEKGKRAYSSKGRASDKKITLEFGLKFSHFFDKYIKIRNSLNIAYTELITNQAQELLFIKLPILNNVASKCEIMGIDEVCFDHFNEIFKKLTGTNTLTNKQLRDNVSNIYFNQTNSPTLTSIKLCNTPKTAYEDYTKVSFHQLVEQFTNYFTELDRIIIMKGRIHSNKIPIHIKKDSDFIDIPLGHCNSNSPKLAKGFNSASPIPLCGNHKGCLFCDSYIVHLNEVDLRKILSFKYILELSTILKDEHKIVLYRINEILELLILEDEVKKIFNNIKTEVEEGFLDEYWANHLDLLLDLKES